MCSSCSELTAIMTIRSIKKEPDIQKKGEKKKNLKTLIHRNSKTPVFRDSRWLKLPWAEFRSF